MNENNTSDLFNKMLGTVPNTQPQEQKEEVSVVVDSKESQTERTNSSSSAPSNEQNQSYSSSSSPNFFSQNIVSSSKNQKKSDNAEKMPKKINTKLVVGIPIALVVVVLLCYFGFGIILPAKSNASKISKNFYDSEISNIFNDSIAGNSIREKIFINSLKDYPNDIKNGYLDNKISFEKANSIFTSLTKIGLFDNAKISESKEYIDILESSKKAFTNGEKYFSQGKYNEAIIQFSKVVSEDPNYDSAQNYISQCSSKYKDSVISSANSALSSGNYEKAIQLLEEASQVLMNDSDISFALDDASTKFANYLKNNALNEARNLITENNYPEAIKLINSALEKNANDIELINLLNTAESQYVSSINSQIDALLSVHKFFEAEALINEAIKVIPDSEALSKKKAEIEEHKPVLLSDTLMINSRRWNWNDGVPKDPFENDYSSASNYVILSGNNWDIDTYGEFRVYQKYTHLTGVLAPYTEMDEDRSMVIQVYADDKLVYTSPEITRKTDAITMDVNIANADYIKIYADLQGLRGNSVILSDLSLYAD